MATTGSGLAASASHAWWRSFVVVLAVTAFAQLAIELLGAPRQLSLGTRGEALFDGRLLLERGPITIVVDALSPQSPLVAAGVQPGDRLRYDRPAQHLVRWTAGDQVSLTAIRGSSQRRVQVTVPPASSVPPYAVADYVIVTAARLLAMLVGLVVGWRRPEVAALRALSATALMAPMVIPFSAAEAMHLPWLDAVADACSAIGFGVLGFFVLNYPDDRPSGWRAVLRRLYPAVFGLQLVSALVYVGRLHSGHFEPIGWWLLRVFEVINPLLFFVGVVLAWRAARGETRIRLQWILATVGVIMATIALGNLNRWAGRPLPAEQADLIQNASFVLAHVSFLYAIFRHRIFDFGLAVNRALIFAIVGAILFGAIQLVHSLASELLHFDDRNKAVLLSTILAVAAYLSFNRLKSAVEKAVDWLFFSSWARREQELQHAVEQARFTTDAAALGRLFVAAIERFTGGAGCAHFQRAADGSYARQCSTLGELPTQIGANHETVLALRAQGDAATPNAALPTVAQALPMWHRGQLLAFALLGPAPGGTPYRPDQIVALRSAAEQFGNDFHAIRSDGLERLLAAEQQAVATLRAQLGTALPLRDQSSTCPILPPKD